MDRVDYLLEVLNGAYKKYTFIPPVLELPECGGLKAIVEDFQKLENALRWHDLKDFNTNEAIGDFDLKTETGVTIPTKWDGDKKHFIIASFYGLPSEINLETAQKLFCGFRESVGTKFDKMFSSN